jgi:hypothetical protein
MRSVEVGRGLAHYIQNVQSKAISAARARLRLQSPETLRGGTKRARGLPLVSSRGNQVARGRGGPVRA